MLVTQAFADVNGTRLYYEMAGFGSPVVFIHGLGADTRVWDAQFTVFAERHRAIRYDTRGHGKSAAPNTEPYSHAADLSVLLEHLGVDRAVIIGQSMGGGIALDFALAFPEKTTSLILVDSTVGGFDWSDEWYQSWAPIYGAYATSGAGEPLELVLAHPLLAPSFRQPGVKTQLTTILSDYSGWHFMNDDPLLQSDPPALHCLGQIHTPVLVLIGELDLPDFHTIGNILVKDMPNAQKVEITDAGHVLMMEAPAQFNDIVLRFLAAI
jgi:pimeloyl-ACP methyl ester carboxylesterase